MSTDKSFDIAQLYEAKREALQLNWQVAEGSRRLLRLQQPGDFGSDLVGHFNPVHPGRLHVVGIDEAQWIADAPDELRDRLVNNMLHNEPFGFFISDGLPVPPTLLAACVKTQTPLFTTQLCRETVIETLRRLLARRMAETTTLHGVLMDVFGIGVLITGNSGVGKSELALDMLSRGHGLVADDAVDLARVAPNTLDGQCPGLLRDYLEVRGLGFLNIRTIFGETACRRKIRLRLVAHLQKPEAGHEAERLPLNNQVQAILGIEVRKIVLPVAAGRNLAVLLEAAMRNTILQLRGIDSTEEFMSRQQEAIRNKAP